MTEKKKDVLQPVDDEARRQAKALVRSARHAALATIDPLDGSPAASRVSLATAMDGSPVFLISRLSGHFTNLVADGRCSLLIGDPGKGDPLAHPRMTLIGRAVKLEPGAPRDRLKARYLMRHPKASLYVDFPDFAFWRFTPVRVSLNCGFGRAFAPTPGDVLTSIQGFEALEESEAGAVQHMNSDHVDAVQRYALAAGRSAARWLLACIDPEGLDLVSGDDVARIWFDPPLATPADLRPALVAMAKR
jgi:putative heme iron utilization protein